MESQKRFTEIRARSMRHDVLRQLRDAILDGTFKPGERLNESEIAREMGISRGPVREALLALEGEGLVKTEHWRGSFVARLDPHSYRELVEMRVLLETHAARVAAIRCTPQDFAELEGIIERMRAACAAEDLEEIVDHDIQFHRTICRLANNSLLLKTWEQLSGRLRLAILLSLKHGCDAAEMVETHPPVLEALRCRDPDLTAEGLNRRTWDSAERVISILSSKDGQGASA